MNFGSILAAVTSGPTDWFIIGAVLVIVIIDALRSGANRASALAFAFPMTLVLVGTIPHAFLIGGLSQHLSTPLLQMALFVVLLVIVFLLSLRILFFLDGGTGSPLVALIASVAAVAIILTIWLQVPALEVIYKFGPQVRTIFGEAYRFWWMLGALLGLAAVRS